MCLLALMVTAATYARSAIGPLQEALRSAMALSDNQIAFVQGPAQALPIVTLAVPLGLLVDRYRRNYLLCLFMAMSLTGGALTAMAPNLGWLAAARAIIGISATAVLTVCMSLLADIYPPERRGRATMILVISQMGGNAIAFWSGGTLLSHFGSAPDSWRETVLWLTVPPTVMAAVPLIINEPAHRESRALAELTKSPEQRRLWRHRSLLVPLMASIVMLEMAFGAAYVWAAPAFSRAFGLAPDQVGRILAGAMLVSGVLGPVGGGFLADYCQRSGGAESALKAAIGLAAVALPLAAFAIAGQAALASSMLVLFLVLVEAGIVLGTSLITVVVPAEVRGLALAVLLSVGTVVGLGVAPMAVSFVSSVLGRGPAGVGESLSVCGALSCILSSIGFGLSRSAISRQNVPAT